MGVNGVAAAQTLRGYRNLKYGMCLFYVWQAYKAHGAVANGSYPTALAGWNGSPGKHEGDRNPPAGVPVWFGAKAGSSAGDVVISLGGGRVVATDYPVYGVVGECTIDERQRQIGRPYLGWTETILGATIDFSGGGQPADVGGGQRTVGSSIVRRRAEPTSKSAEAGDALQPGAVGNFVGWIHGESVEGNDVWYKGTSGNWFWSGGFREGANGSGLTDLNAPSVSSSQRIVVANSVARRRMGSPSTSAQEGEALQPNTVGNFKGWVKGQSVEGNDVWFVGISGDFFWSGGFTDRGTAGLADLNKVAPAPDPQPQPEPQPEPQPSDPNNPRGLPTYDSVYPGASIGLVSPFTKGADRGKKGTTSVTPLIDRFIIHHTATTSDQLDWFSYENARSVSPSFYLRPSGQVIELIRPGLKPAATGPDWNYRSIAVETLNTSGAPEWQVSDAELEALAQMIAWLASYDGKVLDGVPVSFKIDRTHVIGHREAVATECPGPYIWARMDAIVARAQAVYAEKYATPVTPPAEEEDTVKVPRSKLQEFSDWLKSLLSK